MTPKSRIALLVLFTAIVTAQSFVFWTNKLTGFLSESIQVSVVDNQKITDNMVRFAAEDEGDRGDVQLMPTTMEPETSGESSLIERILKSPEQKELEQWEVERWLTLSIPQLDLRVPVYLPSRRFWDARQWDLLEEQMQVGLLNGATAYPHSVGPGTAGSVIIAGHSSPPNERAEESKYGHMFASLPNIERGDTITITSNGTLVTYEVVRTGIVEPTDTEILVQQTDKSLLKLITCYPVGSTKNRFVVTAVKVTD